MKRTAITCTLLAIALAGCLTPRRDDSKFFVLAPISDPAAAAASAPRSLVLGLGPVKLPDYLDRQEIVTRMGPDQLELSSTNRWAEPLDSDFTRVLAQDLSTHLATQRITFFPWYSTTHVDYQIKVDVYRFESDKNGAIDLTAHWQILDGTGKLLIARDSTCTETAKAGDQADVAAAMSRALGRLSLEIASAVASAPVPTGESNRS